LEERIMQFKKSLTGAQLKRLRLRSFVVARRDGSIEGQGEKGQKKDNDEGQNDKNNLNPMFKKVYGYRDWREIYHEHINSQKNNISGQNNEIIQISSACLKLTKKATSDFI
jgi:hypothetical protein